MRAIILLILAGCATTQPDRELVMLEMKRKEQVNTPPAFVVKIFQMNF